MAYPETYDTITNIDLGECVIFSHLLTDGIIDEFTDIETGKDLMFFVKYGSGTPKVDIIDPVNDSSILSALTGTYSSVTTLHKFTYSVPGTWEAKPAIVKVYSDESDLIFTRKVCIVPLGNVLATKADIDNTISTLENKIDTIDSGLKQVISNVVDEVNENQTIIESENSKITFAVTI